MAVSPAPVIHIWVVGEEGCICVRCEKGAQEFIERISRKPFKFGRFVNYEDQLLCNSANGSGLAESEGEGAPNCYVATYCRFISCATSSAAEMEGREIRQGVLTAIRIL